MLKGLNFSSEVLTACSKWSITVKGKRWWTLNGFIQFGELRLVASFPGFPRCLRILNLNPKTQLKAWGGLGTRLQNWYVNARMFGGIGEYLIWRSSCWSPGRQFLKPHRIVPMYTRIPGGGRGGGGRGTIYASSYKQNRTRSLNSSNRHIVWTSIFTH